MAWGAALGFLGTVVVVTVLIHLYLWKRLVRDTTRRGRARRIGGFAVLALALLAPGSIFAARAGARWLAAPGYMWIALMFYLLVVLFALEIPMLVAKLWMRRAARRRTAPAPVADPALVGAQSYAGPPATGASATSTTDAPAAAATRTAMSSAPTTTLATNTTSVASAPDGSATTTSVATPTAATAPATSSSAPAASAPADPASGGRAADHDPDRRLLLARGAAIFAGLTAAGIVGFGVRTALGPPTLNRAQIPLDKLPRSMDGFRIALVSDIHIGPLAGKAHCARVVAAINGMDADIVTIVGDLVDGDVPELGAAAAPLRDLRSRHGSFFVTGNHEYYSGHEQWIEELARLGVRPLRNERQEIVARSGVLDLAGVNDLAGEGFGDGPDFAKALDGRDPARPVVLLAHQPIQVHEAARHGVDLQLSGHTHGGQMVPFSAIVRLSQPLLSGLATIDGTQVYVTNGAGFWGPPVRVGADPQVTLLELRATVA